MSRVKHGGEKVLLLILVTLPATKSHNSTAGSHTPLVHDCSKTNKDISIKTRISGLKPSKEKHKMNDKK